MNASWMTHLFVYGAVSSEIKANLTANKANVI